MVVLELLNILSKSALLLSVLLLIAVNVKALRKIHVSDDLTQIRLDSIWKTGMVILGLGLIVVSIDSCLIFYVIGEASSPKNLTSAIKQNLLLGAGFVALFALSLANLKALQYYRQFRYNRT